MAEMPEGAAPRRLDGLRSALALAIFAFGVWSVLTWDLDDAEVRAVFFGWTLAVAFLFFPAFGGRRPAAALAVDIALAGVGVYVAAYIGLDFEAVFSRAGAATDQDLVVAAVAVLLVLETTRRTTGWALPILAAVFLLYPLVFGPWLPGILRTAPFGLERVLTGQYLSLDGLLGPAFKVMIEFIFLFIVFGAFLQRFGVTEFFIDLARALSGNRPGGSAKVAVIASGLMGSVSGSAVANVVSTGVITIPMMRREGYRAAFAGAVEAAASTGGQIMPPVMGASAFLMAEFARIPYARIMLHALVPAVLYFATVWLAANFEARRLRLAPVAGEAAARLWPLLKRRGLALVPIVFLTTMIVSGHALADSVLQSILVTIAVAAVVPATRRSVTLANLIGAVREGVDNAIPLFTASACAGIVIGIVTLTGLGLKISTFIVDLSQGVLFVALVLSALTCLVMGLGLPTQIIYLTLAILVAPGLVQMGVEVASAHLFIMYFGMMSMVTPPICFAAFAAASLTGARLMETGLIAFRLALAGQLVPFYFAYNPGLLLIGGPGDVAEALIRGCVGLFAGGLAFDLFRLVSPEREAATPRVLLYPQRALFAAAAIALIFPEAMPTLLGAGLLACALALTFLPLTAASRAPRV